MNQDSEVGKLQCLVMLHQVWRHLAAENLGANLLKLPWVSILHQDGHLFSNAQGCASLDSMSLKAHTCLQR